uniref:Importin subunit beta-1/Transportin-1-like TPR repeats domain-containing protein n=1 Tax=Tetraselmis chuii TaxID=63592 RepID=A0A7S1X4C3_9CHLO
MQAALEDGDSSVVNHNFSKAALQSLVPILLAQLIKQEEGSEGDDSIWDIAVASGACITLLAACCCDEIIPCIMPFVQANISKKTAPEDWRLREAATTAFGAILDGPSHAQLQPLVEQGLGYLMVATKDENAYVRHTTLWCIGQIFLYLQGVDGGISILTPHIQGVLNVLKHALEDTPSIATRACFAICELSACYEGVAESPLTPYFQDIVTLLLATADRPVHDSTNLAMAAFEAINDMVRNSGGDTILILGNLMQVIIQKLQAIIVPANTVDQAEKLSQLQGYLCGVLQVIIQKLAMEDPTKNRTASVAVLQCADELMRTFIAVFHNRGVVFDEALLAVGALTVPCGKNFNNYMQAFYPILESGLKNFEDWQVCIASVGLVGDIARAIGEELVPYCKQIMTILWGHLVNSKVHRNVKPQILSVFGDIALQIGDRFEPYMADTFQMLNSAARMAGELQHTSEDMIDYNNQLRQGILEAYTGIFQGMTAAKINQWLYQSGENFQHVVFIIDFIEKIAGDVDGSDEEVTKAAVGLLGDVASTVHNIGVTFKTKNFYVSLITSCSQSADETLASTARWAGQAIQNSIIQAA